MKKSLSGVTITEVLISLLIFSLAATGVLRGFVLGLRWAESLAHRTSAIALAQAKIEEKIGTPYTNLSVGVDIDSPIIDKGKRETEDDDLSGVRLVIITKVDGYKKIRSSVYWKEFGHWLKEDLITFIYP